MKRRLFFAWALAALAVPVAEAKGRGGGSKRRSSGGGSRGGGSRGCGSRGGPGYRKPNGQCASWKD